MRKTRRQKRNRAKILGTAEKPRLSVFRSNKFIYAQLIDDFNQKTLVSASVKELKSGKKTPRPSAGVPAAKSSLGTKTEQAQAVGELLAEKAQKNSIKKAVFNKGSYQYHGRVKAVAEGARSKGLIL